MTWESNPDNCDMRRKTLIVTWESNPGSQAATKQKSIIYRKKVSNNSFIVHFRTSYTFHTTYTLYLDRAIMYEVLRGGVGAILE